MANYKNIVDVESVAEATESMNVLVEDAGSLKKVPAGGMIGGGDQKTLIITMLEGAPMGIESNPANEFVANMSFLEFRNAVLNGELAGATLYVYGSDLANFSVLTLISLFIFDDESKIQLDFYNNDYGRVYLNFYSDNTIDYASVEEQ